MSQTPDTAAAPPLGRAVARRLRLPGPAIGARLPTRIGSLASSVQRFAAATSRPVEVRRALMGPGTRPDDVRPPRWWSGEAVGDSAAGSPDGSLGGSAGGSSGAEAGAASPSSVAPVRRWHRDARRLASAELPTRGLPRAARSVENESSYTPGGMLDRLRGEAVRVRRHEEVVASGQVFSSADRTRMTTTAVRRQPAPPAVSAAPTAPIRRSPSRSAPASSRSAQASSPVGASRSAPSPAGGSASGSSGRSSAGGSAGTPGAGAPGDGADPATIRRAGTTAPAAGPALDGAAPALVRAEHTPAPGSEGPKAGDANAATIRRAGTAPRAGELAASEAPARVAAADAGMSSPPLPVSAGPAPVGPVSADPASAGPESAGSAPVGPDPAGRVSPTPVLRRASWQLQPRTSRLADVAARPGRTAAVAAAPPRAAARLDGGMGDLRRSVTGATPVAAASVALLQTPPAVRQGWAATSHVVRRRSLERAEEATVATRTGAVVPLRRSMPGQQHRIAPDQPAASRPETRPRPGAAMPSTAPASGPAAESSPAIRAEAVAASTPTSTPPGSSDSALGAHPGSTPARPAAQVATGIEPTTATGRRSVRDAGGTAPAAPIAHPSLPGLSAIRRRPRRGAGPLAAVGGGPVEIAPAGRNVAAVATALSPLTDLLTIRRRSGRGAGAGLLATGLGAPAEIRPASGNLAAVPAGPGAAPIVRRTPAQLADPGTALAAPLRRADVTSGRPGGATVGRSDSAPATPGRRPVRRTPVVARVPLLTPALRGAADHGEPTVTADRSAPAAPAAWSGARTSVMAGMAPGLRTAASALAPNGASPAEPPAEPPAVHRSIGQPAAVRPPLAAPAGRGHAGQPAVPEAAALLADPVARRLLRPPAGALPATGTSLVERTAAAFASDAGTRPEPGRAGQPPPVPAAATGFPPIPVSGSDATIRRTSRGLTMTKTSDWAQQLSTSGAPAVVPPGRALVDPALAGAELDAVVDAVVERIEQRVVDELERRGRRDGRGW